MESEGSVSCSQDHATVACNVPVESRAHPVPLRLILILLSHMCLDMYLSVPYRFYD